jgi:hypothetical protein
MLLVDKVSKDTLAIGIEEHGIFGLVETKETKDYALMAKSGQHSSKL